MFCIKINDELSLALVQPSFAKDYLRIIAPNQADFAKFLAWAALDLNENFFLNYITRSLHNYADGIALPCSIIYQDKLVGNIDFHQINPSLGKARIGYWLDPEFRGRGIINKSVKTLIDIGFNEMNISKIEIWTAVENKYSRAVAERLGFIQEGIITQNEKVGSKIYDQIVYGLYKK
ncbi:GNAT family N-acetyltransferase [Psychrobacter raelei]|uniref:GNAT family N-acetyltransferase n=1 Tax=Psychrobacter raelei TaxID=2565531 RepID=UPI003F6121E6